VVIWSLSRSLLSHLVPMNATIRLMVIDAQETLTVRKLAFPAASRSLYCFCHRYSYQVIHQTENPERSVVFACGLKISNLCMLYQLYHVIVLHPAISSHFLSFSFSPVLRAQKRPSCGRLGLLSLRRLRFKGSLCPRNPAEYSARRCPGPAPHPTGTGPLCPLIPAPLRCAQSQLRFQTVDLGHRAQESRVGCFDSFAQYPLNDPLLKSCVLA
jgi:hypothetical protein